MQQNRNAVEFLAAGATGTPDTQCFLPFFSFAVDDFRQPVQSQIIHLRLIAEKIGLPDGDSRNKPFQLRHILLTLLQEIKKFLAVCVTELIAYLADRFPQIIQLMVLNDNTGAAPDMAA